MITCGNCKHWGREGSVVALDADEGSCELIQNNEYKKKPLAVTAFGYDLITRAGFGCVLGEAKESKETSQ